MIHMMKGTQPKPRPQHESYSDTVSTSSNPSAPHLLTSQLVKWVETRKRRTAEAVPLRAYRP